MSHQEEVQCNSLDCRGGHLRFNLGGGDLPSHQKSLPLQSATAYVESTGVPMIGANRHAFREYIKRGVGGGGGRMAIKHGLDTGVSLGVGLSMEQRPLRILPKEQPKTMRMVLARGCLLYTSPSPRDLP